MRHKGEKGFWKKNTLAYCVRAQILQKKLP